MVKEFFKKNKLYILFAISLFAVGEGLYSSFIGTETGIIKNRITNFVLNQYRRLDNGEYEQLAGNYIEGVWEKQEGEYVLREIMDPKNSVAVLKEDLGVNGWRIRFVTLKVIDYYTLSREVFAQRFKREHAVLQHIDSEGTIEQIHIIVLSEHVTGRCSIVDWERPVPVVNLEAGYKMIIRGMPEVYSLLHKEQWFKQLQF